MYFEMNIEVIWLHKIMMFGDDPMYLARKAGLLPLSLQLNNYAF